MKRFKITNSSDAMHVDIAGDRRNPEPGSLTVSFPGGGVEVSRTSDGRYWAHVTIDERATVADSRIDYAHDPARRDPVKVGCVADLPDSDMVRHIAVLVGT